VSADLLPIKTKEPKVAITKQIPAKSAKAATKPKRVEDDFSTPYRPQAASVRLVEPSMPAHEPNQQPTAPAVMAQAAAEAAPFQVGAIAPTVAKPARKAAQWVDLSALEICDSPLSVARALPVSKYEDVLRRMKPGQCIKCKPAEVGPVASSLRSFFSRNGIVAKIRTTLRYETDGLGRVWWVQAGGVQ